MEVFEVYVVGGDGDYDSYIASTMKVGKAVAEREYGPLDYFGNPVRWNAAKDDSAFQSGSFQPEPYGGRKMIIVSKREVLEA